MEMTQLERVKLVGDVADAVIRRLDKRRLHHEDDYGGSEWVTTEEAARILHISVRYLRIIKDRFPHTKVGAHKQGKLRFLRRGLMERYVNGKVKDDG